MKPHRIVLCWLFACATAFADEPFDVLIRNGQLVDGTGNPWVHADVAIRAGRIVAIGKLGDAIAKAVIEAKGKVVAPGFIDMHSHSDLLLLEDGNAPSKIRQGVTTEVLGEGNSAGPSRTGRFKRLGDYFDEIVYPYTRGNNNLVSIIPPWAHEGGTAKLIERLKDATLRPRLKREIREGLPGWYNHFTAVGGDWSRMLVSGKGGYEGLTMDRVIATRTQGQDVDSLDVLFGILIEQGGSVPTVYEHHTEDDMNLALRQPWCSIGSDGSAYAIDGPLRRGNPHPRNFGTFPRVLGVYVRERNVLRLEDAIRKMTSLNAAKIGLKDRGVLRPGAFADVTVFDAERVIDKSTYNAPFQYSEGIEHVLVNGQVVLLNGQPTGTKPGRALRRKSDYSSADGR